MILFKKLRLKSAEKKWRESISRIRATGDYGMCCNEEQAINCAKHYYFDKLYDHAKHILP